MTEIGHAVLSSFPPPFKIPMSSLSLSHTQPEQQSAIEEATYSRDTSGLDQTPSSTQETDLHESSTSTNMPGMYIQVYNLTIINQIPSLTDMSSLANLLSLM